jgi:hypothetical protein
MRVADVREDSESGSMSVTALEDAVAAVNAWHWDDHATAWKILAETRDKEETLAALCGLAVGLLRGMGDPDAVMRELGTRVAAARS